MEENNNIPESDKSEETIESIEVLKKDYSNILQSSKNFFAEVLDIRKNTDRQTTIQQVKDDISIKGHNAWILVCSIFVASIGLNANSTAVVIGAMLISPLMGPILGIGMGVAINDVQTLKRSLSNFGIMIFLSVVTAFTFFYIFPLKTDSSELLARTAPDIRDVLIAFFGGLALIIARTKEGTIASVIFGVAIATALMPPLCTAGYGLAIGKFEYFFGAMYLFVINTIFIALATYLILKLLRFPLVKYANQKKRARTTRLISAVAVLVMIPAIWTFYNVFQESLFYKQANDFVADKVETVALNNDAKFVNELTKYTYDTKTGEGEIELVFIGNAQIDDGMYQSWINQMQSYNKLTSTQLEIVQGGEGQDINGHEYMVELYENAKADNKNKDEVINLLRKEIGEMNKQMKNVLPFRDIMKKAYVLYPELSEVSYSHQYITEDGNNIDSSFVFVTSWSSKLTDQEIKASNRNFQKWLDLEVPGRNAKVQSIKD